MFFKKKITIATHSGEFHPDDAFAVATVSLFLKRKPEDLKIIRTRDEDLISNADFVVDVGKDLDREKKIFDHHQYGGAGKRENGIPYASFGLVWKEYGKSICESSVVSGNIDEKLVQPIDATDNGMDIEKDIFRGVHYYAIEDAIFAMNPTWNEPSKMNDSLFLNAVKFARLVILREIEKARAFVKAENIVKKIYEETEDKRIIVLDENYPWKEILCKYSEPIYVIREDKEEKRWRVTTVKEGPNTIKSRKDLPVEWAGKSDKELVKITGVDDAIFCHVARFICVAKTFNGAMKLAQKALGS